MSTTEPTPDTSQTVVDDVHKVLDDAKTNVTAALADLNLGTLADEARQVVHDAIELAKQRIHDLIHGATPPPAG